MWSRPSDRRAHLCNLLRLYLVPVPGAEGGRMLGMPNVSPSGPSAADRTRVIASAPRAPTASTSAPGRSVSTSPGSAMTTSPIGRSRAPAHIISVPSASARRRSEVPVASAPPNPAVFTRSE
ncbi:hypothetical protein DLE01_10430 [Streptomyces sp. FT05W]|nr:hypothetical protein DLE01_10430 [Streptomyces sp. FT05W]